ncbi:MAG TPA: hypothetical protein VKW04_01025 [Planctomycetota bacterium]|nr:hypothetical protein [Planctomycetota bacterium]
MRLPFLLAVSAALLGQSASGSRNGLQSYDFPAPTRDLKIWLPDAYEADKFISRKFTRKPSVSSPDVVTLRLDFQPRKQPEPPPVPLEPDLMKVDPLLVDLKFTGAVARWRGRPVATARYEGFVQGKVGVYGRMAWLPLEPGTVVVNLYAEPAWASTMNQDWDVILANIEGQLSELTLRERAPNRWLAAKIVSVLGCLVALAGLIMILARMSEAMGGAVVSLGLVLPVIPIGYGFLHLQKCWRGLLVFFSGAGVFGVSLLMER